MPFFGYEGNTTTTLLMKYPHDEQLEIAVLALFYFNNRPELSNLQKLQFLQELAATPRQERRNFILNFDHDRLDLFFIRPQRALDEDRLDRLMEQPGINVHNGLRDTLTLQAVQRFYAVQGPINEHETQEAYAALLAHIQTLPEASRAKVLLALNVPRQAGQIFGPLVSDERFTLLGHQICGKELIARLWRFATSLADEADRVNAVRGIISALEESSNEDNFLMCNQGKVQRLVIAVLQGRLAGVNIENLDLNAEENIPIPDAIRLFFTPARQEIEQLEPLLQEANLFLDENPRINRDLFMQEIRNYIEAQGIN